jgi:hypothetical protein
MVARTSRPRFAASRGEHATHNALGETSTAARETRALPNQDEIFR